MRPGILLYVAFYPPSGGGSGTHRTARLARGLASIGWKVAVLCGPAPSALHERAEPFRIISTYSPFPRHRGTVDGGVRGPVTRSQDDRPSRWRALLRQVLHIPDPQVFWIPFAFLGARRALAGARVAAVFCSGPPFSSFLLGTLLRTWSRAPLVLDYRDVWIDHPWWPVPRWRRGLEAWLESRALARASLVIANHEPMRESLVARHPRIEPRCVVVPNGFDAAELGSPVRPRWTPGERFEIVYAGTLYGPVAPKGGAGGVLSIQQPIAFFEALGGLARRGVFGPGGVRVTFIGAKPGTTEGSTLAGCARDCGVESLVEVLPRVDKSEVVPRLRRAHVLLNIVYYTEAQATQKIYDYLHLEIPLLSLIRDSEVNAAIARRARCGPIVDPDDVPGIARALEAMVQAYAEGRAPVNIDRAFVDRFDVTVQVRDLDGRLRSLLGSRQGDPRAR